MRLPIVDEWDPRRQGRAAEGRLRHEYSGGTVLKRLVREYQLIAAAMYARAVIHGDLKPQNILLRAPQ